MTEEEAQKIKEMFKHDREQSAEWRSGSKIKRIETMEALIKKESKQLILYDAMCQAIDRAYEVDEVKEYHDQAIAYEAYFRQAKNMEAERKATEIRIRAERRAGELLAAMEKHAGGNRGNQYMALIPESTKPSKYGQALKDNQIPRGKAVRWQQLAAVPKEDFEGALAGPEKPSTKGIIKRNKSKSAATGEKKKDTSKKSKNPKLKQLDRGAANTCFYDVQDRINETLVCLDPELQTYLLDRIAELLRVLGRNIEKEKQ